MISVIQYLEDKVRDGRTLSDLSSNRKRMNIQISKLSGKVLSYSFFSLTLGVHTTQTTYLFLLPNKCLSYIPIKNYLSINSVRTNGPTLCPIVLLPYAPEYVEKPLREAHGFVMYTNA